MTKPNPKPPAPTPAQSNEIDFFGAILDPLNDLLAGFPDPIAEVATTPEVKASGNETPAVAPAAPASPITINFDGLFKPAKRPKLAPGTPAKEEGAPAGAAGAESK